MPVTSEANAHSSREHVTFAVDDVVPADRRIWSESLPKSVGRRFLREILYLTQSDGLAINSQVDELSPALRTSSADRVGSRCHPLIDAVHTAFSRHYPLALSPDSIWLAIAQGFSHHVNLNNRALRRDTVTNYRWVARFVEALRGRLVRHQGRKKLTAEVYDLSPGSFERAIGDFSAQIRDETDAVLHETLLCDFTTTTPVIRTASEVVLMDSYSSYFQYRMRCICGIPRITMTGCAEDWERIRARVEVLETYGLGWWVSRLRPILDQFVKTALGHPDREFWRAIYKPKQAYAATCVTGWIADLFPYLGDPPHRSKNHIFEHRRERWAIPVEEGVSTQAPLRANARSGINTGTFPSGLCSVPVQLALPNGSTRNVDLVAGYLGVEQAPDLSLSPIIGWAVTEPPPAAPVLI
jgi:hypothetical protein